jgi:hypothetical protein
MKIATGIKKSNDFGFQLIINEDGMVMGVNLLCKNKVLVKKRFDSALTVCNKKEELELVNQVLIESLKN